MRRLPTVLVLALIAPTAWGAGPVRWSVPDEARMAAEAASWAPPDFKRQLAQHSRRLMQGVSDAAAAETGTRDGRPRPAARALSPRPSIGTPPSTTSSKAVC